MNNDYTNIELLLNRASSCNCATTTDAKGRVYPVDQAAIEYCKNYREPSAAWPHSYLKALRTLKANVALGYVSEREAVMVFNANRLFRRLTKDLTAHERINIHLELSAIEDNLKHISPKIVTINLNK